MTEYVVKLPALEGYDKNGTATTSDLREPPHCI